MYDSYMKLNAVFSTPGQLNYSSCIWHNNITFPMGNLHIAHYLCVLQENVYELITENSNILADYNEYNQHYLVHCKYRNELTLKKLYRHSCSAPVENWCFFSLNIICVLTEGTLCGKSQGNT